MLDNEIDTNGNPTIHHGNYCKCADCKYMDKLEEQMSIELESERELREILEGEYP